MARLSNASNPTPYVGDHSTSMGRKDSRTFDVNERFYLRQIPLNRQGYDKGLAYWGVSNLPLFAYGDGENWGYIRSKNRKEAKEQAAKRLTSIICCNSSDIRFHR